MRALAAGRTTILGALTLAALLAGPAAASDERIYVLMPETLSAWEKKAFEGETQYRTTFKDGRVAVEAKSKHSAPGYYRTVTVDLTKTPYLNWEWRVENVLSGPDERTIEGDDFPARVYLIESHGLLFWKTRGIGYVWAGKLPEGADWPNPGRATTHMFSVRSGAADTGKWIKEKRDVRADFKRAYGEDVTQVDAVAFFSDTDNTKSESTAYYGPIYFSKD